MSSYSGHLQRQGFVLLEDIGSGLSGKTKKAEQPSLGRYVAVKFFDSIFNKHNNNLRKRFRREAFILAEAQHPAIPYVITHGEIPSTTNAIPYIVMEFIEGENLEDHALNNGILQQRQVISIASKVLEALSLVHSKGIIHRDIKPANIMLSATGHTYLIDFSIGFTPSDVPNLTRTTETGDHLGSAEYMSPEQQKDMKNVDHRSDIYSLGLTLCRLLTGSPTSKSLDKPELSIPFALRKAITQACEYNPDDRYKSASEFLRELQNFSGAGHFAIDAPARALCKNLKCPDAKWSPNGYYKGANFITEYTDIHCTSCGKKLIYQCLCGYPIANTQFCGGCGNELFKVPECKACGSYLTKSHMGKDTSIGCKKCLNKKTQAQPQVASPFEDFDDDIPF